MREAELRCMYFDYAFEEGTTEEIKEVCLETIFSIQNDEIQDNGRYMEFDRSVVEFCCQTLEDRNSTSLQGEQVRFDKGNPAWCAKCPFCGSILLMTERGVTTEILKVNRAPKTSEEADKWGKLIKSGR